MFAIKTLTLVSLMLAANATQSHAAAGRLPNGQAVRVTQRFSGQTGAQRYQRDTHVEVEPGTCGWIVEQSSGGRFVYELGVRFDGHADVVDVAAKDFDNLEPVDITETEPRDTVDRPLPGVFPLADLDHTINSFLSPLVKVRVMYHTKPFFMREHKHFDSLQQADSIVIDREMATVDDVARMAAESVQRACPGRRASPHFDVETDRQLTTNEYNGCPAGKANLVPHDALFLELYNRVLRGSESLPNPGDEPITIYLHI